MSDQPPVHRRPAAFWRTFKAVLWSFIGLRSRQEFHKDAAQLNPIHLIAMALMLAFVFVLGLLALVNWVVRQPTGL